MRSFYLTLCATLLLAGCGGGGQATRPEFVPYTIDDFDGPTFAFRYAGIDGNTVSQGTGTVLFENLETLTITRDGMTTEYVAVSPDVFKASDGTGGTPYYDLVGIMGFPIRDADDRLIGLGFFGFETVPSDMPSSGSLTYEGLSGLFVELDGTVSSASGKSSLRADFGTDTVVGTVFDNIGEGTELEARLNLRRAEISGRRITGSVVLADPGTLPDATLSNGSVQATFYGSGARGIAGTFSGSLSQGEKTGSLAGAVSVTNR